MNPPPFVLRPRLVWRLLAPTIFAWSIFGALDSAGDDRLAALGFAVVSALWAIYLWVTRVEISEDRIAIIRLGEVKSSMRLDAIHRWDSYWTGHIPTLTLVMEDDQGHGMSFDAIWWSKWADLKGVGGGLDAPKIDIREDLGDKPVPKILLMGLGAGTLMFVVTIVGIRFIQGESMDVALPGAALVGALFAVMVPVIAAMDYRKAKDREESDE